MKIPDLNKIDIKDLQKIDLSQIQETLLKRPDVLIQLIIIAVTLTILIKTVSGKIIEASQFQNTLLELKKKVAVIKKHDALQKEYTKFISKLPEGASAPDLLDRVADLAGEHGVQIISISPAQELKKKYHTQTVLSVSAAAGDYKDMVAFIHKIETSPFNLRVDRWVGSSTDADNDKGDPKDSKRGISAQIDINAIKFTKE